MKEFLWLILLVLFLSGCGVGYAMKEEEKEEETIGDYHEVVGELLTEIDTSIEKAVLHEDLSALYTAEEAIDRLYLIDPPGILSRSHGKLMRLMRHYTTGIRLYKEGETTKGVAHFEEGQSGYEQYYMQVTLDYERSE